MQVNELLLLDIKHTIKVIIIDRVKEGDFDGSHYFKESNEL